ncbi:MAG: hypothetical protein R2788_15005 [Saprospiraceae bacterium]
MAQGYCWTQLSTKISEIKGVAKAGVVANNDAGSVIAFKTCRWMVVKTSVVFYGKAAIGGLLQARKR